MLHTVNTQANDLTTSIADNSNLQSHTAYQESGEQKPPAYTDCHTQVAHWNGNATIKANDQSRSRLRQSILPGVVIATVPYLIIIGVLLYLVFSHRVIPQTVSSPDLGLSSGSEDAHVYLVDFGAAKLATLASWASNVAVILPPFIMAISSYRIANMLAQYSEDGRTRSLPTPYQLGLLLQFFDAKPQSLKAGLQYLVWKRRNCTSGPLRFGVTVLAITLTLR